ncbi:MAG: MFS transporter [Pseudomonadota bacterium]
MTEAGAPRWPVLLTLGSLTMANTIPRTLVALLLPAIYRQQGLALEWYWVFSIPLWVIPARVLWAPLVDRYGHHRFGRRKSWILPCTVVTVLAYLALGGFEPSLGNLALIISLLVVMNVFLATQEIAVDAYVVEALHPHERSAGATARIIAEETGQLITIAGLMVLYQFAGWQVAISAAGCLFLLLTLPALLRPEVAVNVRSHATQASLSDFLARRENVWIVSVVGFAALAPGLASAIISPFLVDLGMNIGEIGIVLGLSSSFGPIIAGLTLAPWLMRGRSVVQAARLQLCVVAVPSVLFFWLALNNTPTAFAVGGVIFCASLISTPALIIVYTARLGWTSNQQAGTDFTIQEAIYVLFRGILPGATAGPIAAATGWPGFFIFMGVVSLLGFGSFVFSHDAIQRRVEQRRGAQTSAPEADAGFS